MALNYINTIKTGYYKNYNIMFTVMKTVKSILPRGVLCRFEEDRCSETHSKN